MVKIYSNGEKTYADDSRFAQIMFGRGSRGSAGQPNAKGKIQLVKLYGTNGQMKGFKPAELGQMDIINNAQAVIFPEKYGIESANAYLERGRYLWSYYAPVRDEIKSANPDIDEIKKTSSFYEQVVKIARGERDASDFNPVDNISTSEKLFSAVFLETLNTSEPNTDFEYSLKSGESYAVHVDSDLGTLGAKSPLSGIETVVKQLKIYVSGLPEIRIASQSLRTAIGTFVAQPTLAEVKNSPEMSGRQYGMQARNALAEKVAGAEDFIQAVVKDRLLKQFKEYTDRDLHNIADQEVRVKVTEVLEDTAREEFGWINETTRANAINQTLANFPAENYAQDFVIDGARSELIETIKIDTAQTIIKDHASHFNVTENTTVVSDLISNISLDDVKDQVATELKTSPVYKEWTNADGDTVATVNLIGLLPSTLQGLTSVHDDTDSWLADNQFKKDNVDQYEED